jgi:hypothetical protein
MEEKKPIYCKKLIFKNPGDRCDTPTILLGRIEKEDQHFYYFRTSRRQFIVRKEFVLCLSDTSQIFRGVQNE